MISLHDMYAYAYVSGEDVGVGLASRVHAPGDGRGDGKCDIYMYVFEREFTVRDDAGSRG